MAMQSVCDEIRVNYISIEDKRLFPAHEIILLSRSYNFDGAMFR